MDRIDMITFGCAKVEAEAEAGSRTAEVKAAATTEAAQHNKQSTHSR